MSDQTAGTGAPDFSQPGTTPNEPGTEPQPNDAASSVQTLDTEGNVQEAAPSEHVVNVAPSNTHGDEPYLGTDPIYQNHATDQEAPQLADEPLDETNPNDPTLVEERAQAAADEAVEAGQFLGRGGFTQTGFGTDPPPRTVEDVDKYNTVKEQRMQAIREESAKHDPRAVRLAAIDERVSGEA